MKNVYIISKSGVRISIEDWQKIYGLPVGSDKVGVYFSLKDKKLRENLLKYGELLVAEQLIRVLDEFRARTGLPCVLSAFNRSQARQNELRKLGYRAAAFSPHVAYMAADIDTASEARTRDWVKVLMQVSIDLGIKIRIGFEQYLSAGQTFIHLDVCPEYYAKGKPFHNKVHPAAWEISLNW